MSTLLQTLSSYVPTLVVRRAGEEAAAYPRPDVERFEAAVLLADVKGFTALTERLAARGASGAEDLVRIINQYLGRAVEMVLDQGGDVVKFAGDALVALWPAFPGGASDGRGGGGLAVAARSAARCALAIQAALHDIQVAEDVRLTMKVSVGTGPVAVATLGGVFGRWELTIAGPPVAQVGRGNSCARPGDVILSAEAWAAIGENAGASGGGGAGGWAIEAVAPIDAPDAGGSDGAAPSVRLLRAGLESAQPEPAPLAPPGRVEARPEGAAGIRAFIPAAIRTRLDAGQTDWLAELRRVTVVFVNLPDLNHETPLDLAQRVMAGLQAALYRYEGSINKISVDDKGASLVAALGLPPLAHEDDPVRGLRAAMAMREALAGLGVRCSIGVTTGRAFCGSVGAPRRREYTLMGDVVNLAARLMQEAGRREEGAGNVAGGASAGPGARAAGAAGGAGGVLCDETTARAGAGRLELTPLGPVRVKGKQAPVAIYRPSAGGPAKAAAPRGGAGDAIVERDREREMLSGALDALLEAHRNGRPGGGAGARPAARVVIEGDPGLGKSLLLRDLVDRARAAGARVLGGAADAIESGTPYYALRPVFAELFGLEGAAGDPDASRTRVLAELPDDLLVLQLAPLLGVVLPFEWPENEFTAILAGKARADQTHELLARVLQASASAGPLVLAIDDAQWLDTGSLSLLKLVADRVGPLLIALAARPVADPVPADYAALVRGNGAAGADEAAGTPGTAGTPGASSAVTTIRLDRVSRAAAVALAARRLGVPALPEAVASAVADRAEGNPFFAEELAYAIRDAGLVSVEGGECRVAPGAGDPSGWRFPDTVQGVVLSRIDRLSAREQLTMKVASVVGRVFQYRTLADVHPIEADRGSLGEHFDVLRGLDLTPLERPAPELTYIFKHLITQEVAYNLMPLEQRCRLHRAVARWYERAYAADLAPHYPLLAHHWSRAAEGGAAGDGDQPAERSHAGQADEGNGPGDAGNDGAAWKAVDYLRRAADQAVRQYVNREAVGFYEQGLRVSASLPEGKERCRRELQLLLGLGAVLMATRGYGAAEVEQTYARAEQLCDAAGDDDLLFAALRGLWAFAIGRADFHRAKALAERMLALADRGSASPARGAAPDRRSVQLEAHRAMGNTLFWLADFEGARLHMEQGIDLYVPDRDRTLAFLYGQDPDVANRGMQAWPLALTGRTAEAAARSAEALAHARAMAHPYSLGYALVHDMCCRQFQSDVGGALARAQEAAALAAQHSFPNWLLAALAVKAWAVARQGKAPEGIEQLKGVIGMWRSVGSELCVPYFLSMLADACLVAGRAAEGLEAIESALSIGARNDDRWGEAEAYRLRGELLLQRAGLQAEAGARAAAEWAADAAESFRKAQEIARRQGAQLLERRAADALVRSQRDPSHRAELET